MAGITTFIWLKRTNLLVFFFLFNKFLIEEDGGTSPLLSQNPKVWFNINGGLRT